MNIAAIVGRRRRHKPAPASLLRHQRKCRICNHEHRRAIESRFLFWERAQSIVKEFGLGHRSVLDRHAQATGLMEQRRENFTSALDSMVEQCESAPVTAASILRAIRAYSCLKATAAGSILPNDALSAKPLNPQAPREFLIETPRLKIATSRRKQMPLANSNRDKTGTFEARSYAQGSLWRDSVWTHIHELPDLLSPALCYSSRVTREARRSRRALLGFRATAPAPPRFERAPSPLLYLPGSVVSRHGRILVRAMSQGRSRCRATGFKVGAPCFSRGSWTSVQRKRRRDASGL